MNRSRQIIYNSNYNSANNDYKIKPRDLTGIETVNVTVCFVNLSNTTLAVRPVTVQNVVFHSLQIFTFQV